MWFKFDQKQYNSNKDIDVQENLIKIKGDIK